MSPLDFIILVSASWRLAYFVAKEDGPFSFMKAIREQNDLGGLLTCVYCASVWAAAIMLFFYQYGVLREVVRVAGISGAALLVQRYTGMDY